MSTSFIARFDASPRKIERIFEDIRVVLKKHKIKYANSLIEMSSHNGWPTVKDLNFQEVSMENIAKVAPSLWGLGLSCISQVLVREFGRGSASEVDLIIFRSQKNQWTIHYLEGSSATDHRIESEEANLDLISLQIDLCSAAKFKLSIYEESADGSPTVTLRDVETALKRISKDDGSESSFVVSTELMDLDRARQLAGPRADRVWQSLDGFIVFPFLIGYPK